MTDIAKEIDAMRKQSTPELIERYRQLWGKEPRCRNKEHLWRRCCWRLQEQRCGGLSEVAKKTIEQLITQIDLPLTERQRTVSGVLKKPRKPGLPPIGSVITRRWHGEELQLRVLDGGFELKGVTYKSLSEAARAATGARWNGPLFWGLTKRKEST